MPRGRGVLVQGAAHRHVEQLAAATDREDRDVQLECRPGERHLARIGSRRGALADSGIDLAVADRIDIVAADEDETVEPVQDSPCIGGVVMREQHGQASGVEHRLRVLGAERVQIG
ncbi:MAG: hypothetical protein ABIP17_15435 [Ilumatobacteraceae bacterium]